MKAHSGLPDFTFCTSRSLKVPTASECALKRAKDHGPGILTELKHLLDR